jgi:magnesium transporter
VQRFAFRKRRPPAGSRPGVLALPVDAPPRRIHVIDYTAERADELDVVDVELLARFRGPESVTWIEVEGLGDEAGLRRIGEIFGIHPLALADVVNAPQRPKAEVYEGHDLVICAMARLDEDEHCSRAGQLRDRRELRDQLPGGAEDVFDCAGASETARWCARWGDFLAYALIDTLIDGYYPVLEAIGEELEWLENAAVGRPVPATLAEIHSTRRLILTLVRTMRQQRDAVNALVRGQSPASACVYSGRLRPRHPDQRCSGPTASSRSA